MTNSLYQLSLIAELMLASPPPDESIDHDDHEQQSWIQDHSYAKHPPTATVPTSNILNLDDVGVGGNATVFTTTSLDTAAESWEGSVTRCICEFQHDDGYMICCDLCGVWQHVVCMGVDRLKIPDVYLCELCEPRYIDKVRALRFQQNKLGVLRRMENSNQRKKNKSSIGGPVAEVPFDRELAYNKKLDETSVTEPTSSFSNDGYKLKQNPANPSPCDFEVSTTDLTLGSSELDSAFGKRRKTHSEAPGDPTVTCSSATDENDQAVCAAAFEKEEGEITDDELDDPSSAVGHDAITSQRKWSWKDNSRKLTTSPPSKQQRMKEVPESKATMRASHWRMKID